MVVMIKDSLDSLRCIAGNIMKSFKECDFEAVESEFILLKIELYKARRKMRGIGNGSKGREYKYRYEG